MDWLQFISSVVGSLAWPLAVVILGVMFREQFRDLLKKMRHAKGAGIELDFSEDVKKVAAEAVEVKAQLPKLEAPTEDRTKPGFRRIDQLDRPEALILSAWAQVEATLLEFIAARGVYVAPNLTDNVGAWLAAIAKEQVLPARIAAVLHELYELRNRVAHWSIEPTRSDALGYVEGAEAVLTSINTFTREAKAGNCLVFGQDFTKKPGE